MTAAAVPLVLASASPRRLALLRQLGLDPQVDAPHVAEDYEDGESPREHVLRLARAKAAAVAPRHAGAVVVGGDTVVVLDGRILGKPRDASEAEEMLRSLAGRRHDVVTGIAVAAGGRVAAAAEATGVCVRALSEAEIADYVASGEPFDKAGAYGIQGLGAALVARVEGDYYTVVGFPVARFVELLPEVGYRYTARGLEPRR